MLLYEAVEFSNRVGPSYIRCIESRGPMAGGLDSWKCQRYMHSSHVFPVHPNFGPRKPMVGSVVAKAGASLHSCEHLILTSFTSQPDSRRTLIPVCVQVVPYSRCWDDENLHKHTARHADPVEAVEPAIYLSFFGVCLVEGN